VPQSLASATYNSANQQTGFGTQSLTYDLNGNLTSDGTNTYTWNGRNQLVSISGSVNASFQYDAFGRRANKTVSGTSTNYLYDGPNVVQELSTTTLTANMLTGGLDEIFMRSDAGGTWSYLRDGLGSTLALADSSSTIQSQYTYNSFGGTTSDGVASDNATQYTGRENDGTDLYYYRARYYSPSLQRFISEDPIGLGGGINLYAYVSNDPGNLTDPEGLQPVGIGFRPEEYPQMTPAGRQKANRRLAARYKDILDAYNAGLRERCPLVSILYWMSPINSVGAAIMGARKAGFKGALKQTFVAGTGRMGLAVTGIGIGGALIPVYDATIGLEGWLRDSINEANSEYEVTGDEVHPTFVQAPWGRGNAGAASDFVDRWGKK
jgi:RHS repeat-associated protein